MPKEPVSLVLRVEGILRDYIKGKKREGNQFRLPFNKQTNGLGSQ